MSEAFRLPVVCLISGRGTNLQCLIDGWATGELPVELCAVISNRPQAAGLARAERAGIRTEVVDHRDFTERGAFEQALRSRIDAYSPRLVVLAGFMRVLGTAFVDAYRGRMLNIHPSLLPELPGLDTHRRALDADSSEHGASVHFVSPQVDGGPVVVQARVPVLAGDTPESLAARVLEREHIILPAAVRWFAQGRLRLEGEQVYLDDRPLTSPVILDAQGQWHFENAREKP